MSDPKFENVIFPRFDWQPVEQGYAGSLDFRARGTGYSIRCTATVIRSKVHDGWNVTVMHAGDVVHQSETAEARVGRYIAQEAVRLAAELRFEWVSVIE